MQHNLYMLDHVAEVSRGKGLAIEPLHSKLKKVGGTVLRVCVLCVLLLLLLFCVSCPGTEIRGGEGTVD